MTNEEIKNAINIGLEQMGMTVRFDRVLETKKGEKETVIKAATDSKEVLEGFPDIVRLSIHEKDFPKYVDYRDSNHDTNYRYHIFTQELEKSYSY